MIEQQSRHPARDGLKRQFAKNRAGALHPPNQEAAQFPGGFAIFQQKRQQRVARPEVEASRLARLE